MKKLAILLVTLFALTTIGCVSKPAPKTVILLPPMPERIEQKEPETLADVAKLLNYYEHLVQEWELWGERTSHMVEMSNKGVTEP